jgi:hypothetical protein
VAQAIIRAIQRQPRLVAADIRRQRGGVARRNIRQVGQQHIHRLWQRRQQIALEKDHTIRHAQPLGVRPRQRQRIRRDVGGVDARQPGRQRGDRQRDRSAARSDVGDS